MAQKFNLNGNLQAQRDKREIPVDETPADDSPTVSNESPLEVIEIEETGSRLDSYLNYRDMEPIEVSDNQEPLPGFEVEPEPAEGDPEPESEEPKDFIFEFPNYDSVPTENFRVLKPGDDVPPPPPVVELDPIDDEEVSPTHVAEEPNMSESLDEHIDEAVYVANSHSGKNQVSELDKLRSMIDESPQVSQKPLEPNRQWVPSEQAPPAAAAPKESVWTREVSVERMMNIAIFTVLGLSSVSLIIFAVVLLLNGQLPMGCLVLAGSGLLYALAKVVARMERRESGNNRRI